MNTFENFYNRIRDAKTAYNTAKTEDEKNTARAAYKAVWDELKELGNAACRLFKEYETSKGRMTGVGLSADWAGACFVILHGGIPPDSV